MVHVYRMSALIRLSFHARDNRIAAETAGKNMNARGFVRIPIAVSMPRMIGNDDWYGRVRYDLLFMRIRSIIRRICGSMPIQKDPAANCGRKYRTGRESGARVGKRCRMRRVDRMSSAIETRRLWILSPGPYLMSAFLRGRALDTKGAISRPLIRKYRGGYENV